MYKMLVLDFDDTLLKDDLSISSENIKAIQKAKDQGIIILFCSGRSDESMFHFIEELDIHDADEYFVSYNGAKIDTIDRQNIFHKKIEQPLLNKIVKIGKEHDVTVQLYNGSKMIVEEINETVKKYVELTQSEPIVEENIEDLEYSTKILLNSTNRELLEELKVIIENKYQNQANVFFSKPNYLEILHKDANKGLAVKYLAEKLGIASEEIIAVGDSFNDIFMIEYAGLGVAVANGREEVKAIANYVTEKDNNNHAVCEVIEKFILK